MNKITEYDTATIKETMYCEACGWPVVDVCCNGDFCNFKDAGQWDWWYYCSNKNCKNHEGEGVFQNEASWAKHINE